MTDDAHGKRAAAETFNEHASAYVTSNIHRAGDDLETLAGWCDGADRVLDVATGAGHTAGAIQEDQNMLDVIASDAAPEMVHTAEREFPGVQGVVADAERLPFQDGAVDAVACRIAAHHFPEPKRFVGEVARVLEPGGTFAFEDNIAPDTDAFDAFLNDVERLRDPTHIRSYRVSEWRSWIEDVGFEITSSHLIKKTIDYRGWVAQLDTPEANRRELEALFADPPEGAEELFEIERDEGSVVSFANLKVLLRATR